MRIRTLKNCMSEGVKGIFRNGFMSLASIGTIAVCLIILRNYLLPGAECGKLRQGSG